jgi:hypothetical protein
VTASTRILPITRFSFSVQTTSACLGLNSSTKGVQVAAKESSREAVFGKLYGKHVERRLGSIVANQARAIVRGGRIAVECQRA